MFKNLLPNQYVQSIYEINLGELQKKGIRAIITDLDNTLVEWDRPEATPEVREWVKRIKEHDMAVTIVSNNTEKRVKAFADPEEMVFIHSARKPMRRSFVRACQQMEVTPEETVVVGDQIFTDVLGGNRAGLQTILVVPVAKSDGLATLLNRRAERFVLRWMRKKGLIQWENQD
ncbi:YqeG family HAD IIIA-type phosphatase [Alkalicoccobacillus gibsonii]|jgi:HAD superfamily phosphatase (TIGR01668 family)|uniref:YqeG family HAD IIIA-type phosphatase n=1 Tax=Alkalicoccobacillus gibsonii TaxID=79881 RepID=UPI001933514F|nr:YqeG family HAD IIIA-type phosphatase [Alkalicoccobacillus gibsonii]MBM0064277.1 YqeG family HAD IIIA-type phosphatase [Alkalicoccobacillus gibsonii]